MSEWKKVRLGEICMSVSDGDHLPPPKSDSGVPFVTISDIRNNTFDLSNTRFVPKAYFDTIDEKRRIRKGDVLYSVVGSYGIPVYADKDLDIAFQRHIAILKPGKEVVSRYLYYSLLNPAFYNAADNVAIGAAQKTITLSALRNLKISLPPLATQRRIASILSNYDLAIANCRRQIALLEETAMRLYKECFKDGKGEMKTLGDLIEQRHKPVSKKGRDNYPCYIPIDQLPQHSLVCLNKKPVQEAESSLISFSKGDVIFGAMRPYFHKVVVATSSGLTRSTCFVLNSKQKEYHAWMICTLFSEETIRFATSISVGATMPYVRWNDLSKMRIVVPSIEAAYKFNQLLDPYWQGLTLLANQIRTLSEARDRLLPKLMKGEIAV